MIHTLRPVSAGRNFYAFCGIEMMQEVVEVEKNAPVIRVEYAKTEQTLPKLLEESFRLFLRRMTEGADGSR